MLRKYKDEQEVTNQGSFSFQLPISNKRHYYYSKYMPTIGKAFKEKLESTSKQPFNLDLENVLFISTLTRSKQPETQLSWCSRRISIQSDSTSYSTEPIRRFSSVSTTSSFSSISSVKRIPSPSVSTDIPIMTSSSSNSSQQEDDPGHTHCDTLHSPTSTATMSELPLYQPCVFYFIDYNKNASSSVNIKPLFTCSTVPQFASGWCTVKNHTRMSRLQPNQNVCCFVQGVEPLWEDEANKGGGRLLIHGDMDNVFEWLLCALIGANLDECVVGVVAAKKQYRDRVEVWMNDKMTHEKIPLFK
jgi:hypothetical protein